MRKDEVDNLLKTEYVRNLNCNYERLLLDKKPEERRYQYCILNRGGIKGLLPCSLRYINGVAYLYYDISSKQNVAQLYGNKCVSRAWVADFLWSMRQIGQELERFLLDSKNIIWRPEQIFQDLESKVFSFLYVPYFEGDSGYLKLMEFLIDHIDYEDEVLVECVYGMYEQLERNGEIYLQAQIYEDAKRLEAQESQIQTMDEQEAMAVNPHEAEYGGMDISGRNRRARAAEKERTIEEFGRAGEAGRRPAIQESVRLGEAGRRPAIQESGRAGEAGRRPAIQESGRMGEAGRGPGAEEAGRMRAAGRGNTIQESGKTKVSGRGPAIRESVKTNAAGKESAAEESARIKAGGQEIVTERVNRESASGKPTEREETEKVEKRGIRGIFEGKKKRGREFREDYRQSMQREMAGYAVAEDIQFEEEPFGRTIFIEEKQEDARIPHRLFTAEGRLLATLDKPVFSIGKKKEEADLVLDSSSVSRIHARIVREKAEAYLEDLNSTNGTFKNGLRLQPYEKRKLEEGDEIKFGSVILIFR